jgi:Co/Zn/Cd efflux system component
LLDQTDDHVAEEIRELVERPGDASIIDLHVWQVGPQARAAIVVFWAAQQSMQKTYESGLRRFMRSLI